MRYVKLQFGCLLVILYIVITYIRAIKRGKSKNSRQYNLLMLVAPIAVIFDGITAWTVNHMDIVPSGVNRLAHLLFFLFMDFTIILTSLYMYNLLIGYEKTAKWKKMLLNLPGMISVFLIIAGMLWNSGTLLWSNLIYCCKQKKVSGKWKNTGNAYMYWNCRSHIGDTDLFSGSTADSNISYNTFAGNLYRFGESFYQTAGNAK